MRRTLFGFEILMMLILIQILLLNRPEKYLIDTDVLITDTNNFTLADLAKTDKEWNDLETHFPLFKRRELKKLIIVSLDGVRTDMIEGLEDTLSLEEKP